MNEVGQSERATQNRVVQLFKEYLGYNYLGGWKDRPNNSNIETELLTANLRSRGYDERVIAKAVERLVRGAAIAGGNLYEANKAVYDLLRYGVKAKPDVGEVHQLVWPIDWECPDRNDFAVAEEVTIQGRHRAKRPDIVLYVNGIALGVLELKRSRTHLSEGIRQTMGNQKPEFIQDFFSTAQLLLAGNDVEGLRYGMIGTPEKYWLRWKEGPIAGVPSELTAFAQLENPLDRDLALLCSKKRLLELVHDFIVYDGGVKKAARPNQYFGVKAAQERVKSREGGIIWHTQGSGKSLTMVWLAKWIRESNPEARVLLITDRTELDEQIEQVFAGADEQIYRTRSGADLLARLDSSQEWLLCSLIHKFRGSDDESARSAAGDAFIAELNAKLPTGFSPKGDFFVFVDEAHRTQSGVMHDTMKAILPGAMFIGFTGTPLLKSDKDTTTAKFGSFIHEYKYNEAVIDGVVLDLRYEARSIEQELTSPRRVDQWFEAKTQGMTDLSKAELKKRWARVQKVNSARPRAQQIVDDILMDMATRPRLMDGRGNAILVGSSIYQACVFYQLFAETELKGKCAIVTSYTPSAREISNEDAGAGTTEKLRQYEIYRRMLADHFGESEEQAMGKVELFEQQVKAKFIEEPGQMRLLIVVDKLLTGFDAPSATYLYLDKSMRDHGLFQAICRVNRLDGEDKDYGYIVDYRDLFNSLQTAIEDYTSGAFDEFDKGDVKGVLSSRLTGARGDLDKALERVRGLCEAVLPPKGIREYQSYFCAREFGDAAQLKANEGRRVDLYKAVTKLSRAYANIANELGAAGYSPSEAEAVRAEVEHYVNVRREVKIGAGEDVDFKRYEADMRHLLDSYIRADPSEKVSDLDEKGLIQLIVELGVSAVDKLPASVRKDHEAVAATIANNVRKVIVDEYAMNPRYYDKLSQLLDDILRQQRDDAIAYEDFLAKLVDVARRVATAGAEAAYPDGVDTAARRALYDFADGIEDRVALVLRIDAAVRRNKMDSWHGNRTKENSLRRAIRQVLPADFDRFDELFNLIKAQNEYR
jgi:type I restriction enzyme R subunit